MKRSGRKEETITFKADQPLAEALKLVANRSEFIRKAVLHALENACPLCQGRGLLTPEQQKHWAGFLASHTLEKCGQCQAIHLVCEAGQGGDPH
jgi:hypothetical protein